MGKKATAFSEGRLIGYGQGWSEAIAAIKKEGWRMPKKGKRGGKK